MKATGRFIGTTSCGFVTGKVYEISITLLCDGAGDYIALKDLCGTGYCWYTSIRTLADNWEIPVNEKSGFRNSISSKKVYTLKKN